MRRTGRRFKRAICHGPTAILAALIASIALLLVPAAASAGTNYTWTGAGGNLEPNWSDGSNWGGAAPSGTVEALTFPASVAEACSGSCASVDDVAGLTASNLDVVTHNGTSGSSPGGGSWEISGSTPLTLTSGLSSTRQPGPASYIPPEISVPISLGGPNTWTVGLDTWLDGGVTGTGQTLTINLAASSEGESILGLGSKNNEVGAATLSSNGTFNGGFLSAFRTGRYELGYVADNILGEQAAPGDLNGTDKNPIALNDASLSGAGTVGPLTATKGILAPGTEEEGNYGALSVQGTLALDSRSLVGYRSLTPGNGSPVAGTNYPQLRATGAVDLGSAGLFMFAECNQPLNTTYTLVEAGGVISGQFVEPVEGGPILNGGIVKATATYGSSCSAPGAEPPYVEITYTEHKVTATVVAAPHNTKPHTTTTVKVSNAVPAAGEAVTYTATVTPETLDGVLVPSGSVEFLDGGQGIGSCLAQSLSPGLSSSTATCMLSYPAAGSHSITASYEGEGSYEGSSSTAQAVTVHAGGGEKHETPSPPKVLKCKKGFKKKKVHGKAKCVKVNHKHKRHKH